jgi:penicillin amidase
LTTPTIIPDTEAVDVEKSFAQAVVSHPYNGSNNWVVSGEKSASGKPMLANDPHLGLQTPAIWYMTHLKSPNVNVSGVIFPGAPGIILGHNDHIAWGVTNTGPDVQDLYIEKRNPQKKDYFLYKGKWEKAKVISEPIHVKDGKTIDYKITITRHGPVISEFAYESGKNTVFALRWTALEPSTELEAVIQIDRAKNWGEFEKALESFHTPMQNFVFASKDGTIAYKANGKIPIRKKGDGLLPVPGWTDEYEWVGYVPFDQLPKMVNPKSGIIATANNKVISDRYPYHISHYWALPYREKRILQVLSSKSKFTVKDFQALQMDQYNLQAEELVPIFVKHLSQVKLTEEEKTAVQILKHWNFYDRADLAGPLIYHHLLQKIGDTLFTDQISPNMMKLFKNRDFVVDTLIRRADRGEKSVWFEEKGGLANVLHVALQQTLKELKEKYGDDLSEWKWGEDHAVQFDHPLASAWFLSPLFGADERYPMGGSNLTVQAADWDIKTGLVNHAASWRFVADTVDLNRSYQLLGPGESGHILSEWYDDQAEAWVKGVYHVHVRNALDKGKKLVLKPGE